MNPVGVPSRHLYVLDSKVVQDLAVTRLCLFATTVSLTASPISWLEAAFRCRLLAANLSILHVKERIESSLAISLFRAMFDS